MICPLSPSGPNAAAADTAMPEVDPQRVGACGGSQGGGLALACAALVPDIRRVAPTSPFLCDDEREVFLKLGHIDLQHLACSSS